MDRSLIKREDLPEVLEPKQIQSILNIGRRQTYELLNDPPFHVVRIGRLIKVPKEVFFNWLDGAKQG
ncbi:helix-turn-helix domain-containing protein [Paenibacillus ehimensis]|uniref:helix-turn-helix domain-containing protein n=1 Tax=Paenibacillus ehimensis TaxID=79264 RepID=UPI000470DB82|nr:helix-turn-helix domain-containing protein [Paenibacillus ehimensis]